MLTDIIRADHPVALDHAIDVLKHGGLVAFPTDTVYGLAALPFEKQSVERLYIVKARNSQKAIAILVGKIEDLKVIAQEISPAILRLTERFWPGPLTLVVPGNPSLPRLLTPSITVGVRMPNHPVALALLQKAGPLAVTSANLSGGENAKTAQDVFKQLKGRIHLILDGGTTPGGVPSTVVDCSGETLVLLRKGPISLEELQSIYA